jgi:hypothetical protein
MNLSSSLLCDITAMDLSHFKGTAKEQQQVKSICEAIEEKRRITFVYDKKIE